MGCDTLKTEAFIMGGGAAGLGDASGSADSLPGEGLGLAFQQANALAQALAKGDLTKN